MTPVDPAARIPARLAESLGAAALLAAGLFFAGQAALLAFGSARLPGPGFFPLVLGAALGLLAIAVLIRSVGERAPREPVALGHRSVLVVLAALAGAALGFERLGAYATLGLFIAALLLLVARVPPWQAALGAGLGMAAVWAVFRLLLGVRLPAGPF
jgi:hypothetical protein